MVKNLPFLFSLLIIGCSILVISSSIEGPPLVKYSLLFASVVLNIWSMIGFILNLGIQKLNKNEQ